MVKSGGTAVAFRFLAGRYHATPWGTHVNEAAVEWPPAPWRVLRALIGVWHAKVDSHEVSEGELERLVTALARTYPHYQLPTATHAHTRHYMPGGTKKTLVFDAFASVARDDDLLVVWPDVELDAELRRCLSLLLERLGYLGRAESWVEARLLDEWSGAPNCVPAATHATGLGEGDGDGELVVTPVPLPAAEYLAWRNTQVADLGLDGPKLAKGKQKLLATLPDRLIDALRLDTGEVRAQRWSRHPGLTYVDYVRPRNAFSARVRAEVAGSEPATTVRMILSGRPLPRIEDAVKIGEVMRAAAMHQADRISGDDGGVPPVLSGHSMGPDNRHEHAFYLPEDADGDGLIEHVVVHSSRGFGELAVSALASIRKIWLDGGQEWSVVFECAGGEDAFSDHPYLGLGTEWISVTPYLHPWYKKNNLDVQDQIRRECAVRGLPDPGLEHIETIRIRSRARRPVHFHRFRTNNRRRWCQPDRRGSFWKLTFPEPVAGPIALGFGCHFGLGLFQANTG